MMDASRWRSMARFRAFTDRKARGYGCTVVRFDLHGQSKPGGLGCEGVGSRAMHAAFATIGSQ